MRKIIACVLAAPCWFNYRLSLFLAYKWIGFFSTFGNPSEYEEKDKTQQKNWEEKKQFLCFSTLWNAQVWWYWRLWASLERNEDRVFFCSMESFQEKSTIYFFHNSKEMHDEIFKFSNTHRLSIDPFNLVMSHSHTHSN